MYLTKSGRCFNGITVFQMFKTLDIKKYRKAFKKPFGNFTIIPGQIIRKIKPKAITKNSKQIKIVNAFNSLL